MEAEGAVGRTRIGCAGWSVHRMSADVYPVEGSHLERYAAVFDAVEINSSFYRPHRFTTYERWARTVPDRFRFSLKIPKTITHERRLAPSDDLLEPFLASVTGLGTRLGPLIVQLPPSLALDEPCAHAFFSEFRRVWTGPVVCEPRHATWFTAAGGRLLADLEIGRIAADPVLAPGGGEPGGWPGVVYYRLHGSPRTYYSAYGAERVATLAPALTSAAATGSEVWCIFDNTALGAAAVDAVTLRAALKEP